MKEQINFSTSRESGTSFEDGGQFDLHAARENLLSLEEVREQRQRAQREALEAPTLERPLAPHERLGYMNGLVLAVRRQHIENLNQDDFRKAA